VPFKYDQSVSEVFFCSRFAQNSLWFFVLDQGHEKQVNKLHQLVQLVEKDSLQLPQLILLQNRSSHYC